MINKTHIPSSGPPNKRPNPEIYKIMGEENIRSMVHEFYQELAKSSIADMFPQDPDGLKIASDKSADFFIFLMGGPPLYHQKHGDPMMKKRHMAFKIDMKARNVWLSCFFKVLENASKKYSFPVEYHEEFKLFIEQFSLWMVNTEESTPSKLKLV